MDEKNQILHSMIHKGHKEFYLYIVYLYYNVVFRLKFHYSIPHQKMVVDLNIPFYACVHLYHMFVNRLTIDSILILHHRLKKIQRKINHNFSTNFARSHTEVDQVGLSPPFAEMHSFRLSSPNYGRVTLVNLSLPRFVSDPVLICTKFG